MYNYEKKYNELVAALQELTGSNNVENPALGVTASVALMTINERKLKELYTNYFKRMSISTDTLNLLERVNEIFNFDE